MTDGLSEAYDMKKWDVFCEYNDLLLENDQLQAENEKLRELVRYMWRTFMSGKTTAAQRAELRKRLGELGVDA